MAGYLSVTCLFLTLNEADMERGKFQFVISIRTPKGYVETGRFFIGDGIRESISILEQLEGKNGHHDPILKLDLIKYGSNGDTVLETLDCTLEQISENVKIITREVFKLANIEGSLL